MKSIALTMVAALGAAIATPASAAASLGDTVTCTAGAAFTCGTASGTIGAGTEFKVSNAFGNVLDVDFTTGQVTVRAAFGFVGSSIGLNGSTGYTLSFADTTAPFTEATLLSSSGVTRFDQTNVQLVNGALQIAFGQNNAASIVSNTATFTVQLAGATASVPEPAAWGLMIAGFGVVGGSLRTQRRRARIAIG